MRELIPRLPRFLERHPALRMDLRMSDQRQELVQDGVDVAFRFGSLTNSGATARRLASPPRLVVASPAYLARAGVPRTPGDLAGHSVIIGPTGPGSDARSFRRNERPVSVRVEGWHRISASEGAIAAAVAGPRNHIHWALELPCRARERRARPDPCGLEDGPRRAPRGVSRRLRRQAGGASAGGLSGGGVGGVRQSENRTLNLHGGHQYVWPHFGVAIDPHSTSC